MTSEKGIKGGIGVRMAWAGEEEGGGRDSAISSNEDVQSSSL